MRFARVILSAIWLGVLCVALALALYVKIAVHPKPKPAPTPTETAVVPGNATREPAPKEKTVQIAMPDYDKGQFHLKMVTHPIPPTTKEPLRAALEKLIDKAPQFPRQTKLLGVEVESGIASLNFNDAIQSGMGMEEERAVLESLQRTVGQFKQADKIRILVNGKPIDSLSGHSDEASQPIPVKR